MKSSLQTSELAIPTGISLPAYLWLPQGDPPRACFFFLHGQGDFAERYGEIAQIFNSHRVAFFTCDLPGHGQAPGKRGHIQSPDLIAEVISSGLSFLRKNWPHTPIGFGGHSLGGLSALYHLPKLQPQPDFSWVSSPLLHPESREPAWKPFLLKPLSRFFPTLTLSTGVTAKLCREYLPGESATEHLQFHNRVSLLWGRHIIEMGTTVRAQAPHLSHGLPLLLTQGMKDKICPPEICKKYAEKLCGPNKEIVLFAEARHEPFSDTSREEFFTILSQWLQKVLQTNPLEKSGDT